MSNLFVQLTQYSTTKCDILCWYFVKMHSVHSRNFIHTIISWENTIPTKTRLFWNSKYLKFTAIPFGWSINNTLILAISVVRLCIVSCDRYTVQKPLKCIWIFGSDIKSTCSEFGGAFIWRTRENNFCLCSSNTNTEYSTIKSKQFA